MLAKGNSVYSAFQLVSHHSRCTLPEENYTYIQQKAKRKRRSEKTLINRSFLKVVCFRGVQFNRKYKMTKCTLEEVVRKAAFVPGFREMVEQCGTAKISV